MIPRLPAAALEQAINRRLELGALSSAPVTLLEGLRVADYVGSHRLRQSRYGEHDLIGASAQAFFEDDGAFLARYEGEAQGREYSAVLFSTFAVVEFNAFTPNAHFLVLAPAIDRAEDAPYRGLWAAQRIERLQLALREPGAEQRLFDELDRLLAALTRAPADDGRGPPATRPRGLLARLLRRR